MICPVCEGPIVSYHGYQETDAALFYCESCALPMEFVRDLGEARKVDYLSIGMHAFEEACLRALDINDGLKTLENLRRELGL